jgi:ribose 5-phosphate isomerase RpiB
MKPINEISIAVGSDHAGYELKQTVMKHLTS